MKKRTCIQCNEPKNETEFTYNGHGGRRKRCNLCQREQSKLYYKAHSKKICKQTIEWRKKTRANNQEYVFEYLLTHPCIECGEKDIVVLDFDHVKNKKHNICVMLTEGKALESIKKEISKCQIRCANCHRRKIAREQDWRRFRYQEQCLERGNAK